MNIEKSISIYLIPRLHVSFRSFSLHKFEILMRLLFPCLVPFLRFSLPSCILSLIQPIQQVVPIIRQGQHAHGRLGLSCISSRRTLRTLQTQGILLRRAVVARTCVAAAELARVAPRALLANCRALVLGVGRVDGRAPYETCLLLVLFGVHIT